MTLAEIERRVYSQNGEDGIIAFLLSRIGDGDRTVVEIGAGTGLENNSRALLEQGWRGVLHECKPGRVERLKARAQECGWNAEIVGKEAWIGTDPGIWQPQVFSLDIDSYDWHVAASMLARGLRPALAVLEYNATLDHEPVTVPIGVTCDRVYFGCSLEAWKALFGRYGYHFATVCSAGINAFFLRDQERPDGVDWLEWSDCPAFQEQFGTRMKRRAMLGDRPLEVVL